MRCEVVAIGTELLLGQIIDSNSSWIGEQLALAGIDSHFQTKVGDNLGRIMTAIRIALERSDAVILCGGLGPTQDDITREAIAGVVGVRLVRQPEIEAKIKALFEARGRVMALNNLRQADVPEGASVIKEMPGTAPGLICPFQDKVIYAVPGVPHEMRVMVAGSVIPDLQRRAGIPSVIKSRVLRSWGHSESGLAELLSSRMVELDQLGNPTLAFQASGIEGIKVRITAKAADEAAALALLDAEEALIAPLIGEHLFGRDAETMEAVVLERLRRKGQTIAIVETLTAGIAGMRLAAESGAGGVFKGSLLATANVVLEQQLDLPKDAPAGPSTSMALASAARSLFSADIGLAATGVIGPDLIESHPVGTVWLGLAIGETTEVELVRLPGDSLRLRQFAVISLLNALRRRLLI